MQTSKMTASLIDLREVSKPVSIMTKDFCDVLPSAGTTKLALSAAMKIETAVISCNLILILLNLQAKVKLVEDQTLENDDKNCIQRRRRLFQYE
jgi:hypothetical protein